MPLVRTLLYSLVGLLLALLAGRAQAVASVGSTFQFTMARAPHPLALDPSLADPAWQTGAVPNGTGPWQNMTTRSPAQFATTAYVLYDDKNLYVGFKAVQTGVPIVASQTTNDIGFGLDDFVGLGVNTSGAGSQAYYFETTPRGVRYQQSNENVRYKPRWTAAATSADGSWSAVMIIPLNVLRVPHGGKQTWRVQFVRGVAGRGEHLSWVSDPIMQDSGGGSWPQFADTRFWAAVAIDVSVCGRVASASSRGYLRLSERRQRSQSFSASQRDVLTDEGALDRRRCQHTDHADDPLRRNAQSGFFERRNRPADDRSARVSTPVSGVSSVFRARCGIYQRIVGTAIADRNLRQRF